MDTYLPDASLTACSPLNPYPAAVLLPWNPTVEEAKAFCSQQVGCGGIVFSTSQANTAQVLASLATAKYCHPQSFSAGSGLSGTSGVAFVRRVYGSCDLRISLSSTASTFYGTLASTRSACVRPGRGLTASHSRTPRPRSRRYQVPPKPTVELSSVTYEVGKEAFVDMESAQNASADGSVHIMATASGTFYYMPGQTHATRDQSEIPFVRDGWYPLYLTENGAKAASIREGGNGQAQSVGPMSTLGLPLKWFTSAHVQVHYMPLGTSLRLFYGDYIPPFALDGYFPLYKSEEDAVKASTSGTAQSHGPGYSSTGHPLSWSTGEIRLYYMPADGPTKYYGNYYVDSEAEAPLYSHAVAMKPLSPQGEGLGASSAAQVTVAEAMPTNTAAAAATLAGAPSWAPR